MERLQANKSITFDGFTSLIHQLIKVAWGEDWGCFMQAFPNGTDPQSVNMPIITYHSKGKRPGAVGKSTQEIKPRFRQYHKEDGETVHVYAQTFDIHVVFNVWAGTNTEVDKLAEKFEDFMMTFTGYFLQNGVQQLIFLEQTDATEEVSIRDEAVVRSFKYLLRLEKHLEVTTGNITEIIGKVGAFSQNLLNDSIDEESIHFKIKEGGNNQ